MVTPLSKLSHYQYSAIPEIEPDEGTELKLITKDVRKNSFQENDNSIVIDSSIILNEQETQASDQEDSEIIPKPSLITYLISLQSFKIFSGLFGWFTSSIFLTFFNKYLFDKTGFNFPLFVTLVHFSLTSIYLNWGFKLIGYPIQPIKNFNAIFIKFIAPISLFGVFEISMGNASYHLLSLSAITVIKSCTVVFIYSFSICFGLETFRCTLLFIVIFIMASISFAVPGLEIDNPWGVLLVSSAVIFSALRWVLVHYLLQIHNIMPLQLMAATQPVGVIFLAIPALIIDSNIFKGEFMSDNQPHFLAFVIIQIFAASFIALCLVLSEYYIVGLTSSLTLCFAGIGKEISIIFLSMVIFQEKISVKSFIGISLSIIGIITYALLRIKTPGDNYSQFTTYKPQNDDVNENLGTL